MMRYGLQILLQNYLLKNLRQFVANSFYSLHTEIVLTNKIKELRVLIQLLNVLLVNLFVLVFSINVNIKLIINKKQLLILFISCAFLFLNCKVDGFKVK